MCVSSEESLCHVVPSPPLPACVPNLATLPSWSTTVMPSTWSFVEPCRSVCAPEAFVPTFPPIVQKSPLEGSGPSLSPTPRTAFCTRVWMAPGSTRTVRRSASTSTTRFMCAAKSRMIPGPRAWPARLDPPPRAVTGTPAEAAYSTTRATSDSFRGETTARGLRRKMQAAVEKSASAMGSVRRSPARRGPRSRSIFCCRGSMNPPGRGGTSSTSR